MSKVTTSPSVSEPERDQKSQLCAEISHLAELSKGQLHAAWCAQFRRQPPRGLSRDLLLRTLAWHLQEMTFGGHDRETVKQLDAYARGKGADPLFRRLKSGTVLVREYHNIRHTVTIVRDGFIWQGKTYSSLSVIARAITDSNWNGPRFFGLRVKSAGEGQGKVS